MSKRVREERSQFDAIGYEKLEVTFVRKDITTVTAVVEYPNNAPDEQTDLELATNLAADGSARELLCPGCSDQEIVLKRCHGCIISDHIHSKFPGKPQAIPRGLQGVYPPNRIVGLLDSGANIFIGRRAPRGVPTKSVGVQRTMHRSRYANPFIISKKGFTLGESLSLYKLWIEQGYKRLSDAQIQSGVSSALSMPETVEEVVQMMTTPSK
jgi:hypothetical protein